MTKKDLYELNSKFSNLDIDSFKELVSFSENKNEKLIDSDKESDQFYEDSFEPFYSSSSSSTSSSSSK